MAPMSLTPATIVVEDDDSAAAPSGGVPSGRAAPLGRAASWEGSVDELAQIMKPYVTHAVCMPAVTPVCVGQSIEKIGQKRQLLTAIRERLPRDARTCISIPAAHFDDELPPEHVDSLLELIQRTIPLESPVVLCESASDRAAAGGRGSRAAYGTVPRELMVGASWEERLDVFEAVITYGPGGPLGVS